MSVNNQSNPQPLEAFLEYQKAMKNNRQIQAKKMLESLDDKELLLVKEAAVAGYMAAFIQLNNDSENRPPNDVKILEEALGVIYGYHDLYPTISGYTPEPHEEEEND